MKSLAFVCTSIVFIAQCQAIVNYRWQSGPPFSTHFSGVDLSEDGEYLLTSLNYEISSIFPPNPQPLYASRQYGQWWYAVESTLGDFFWRDVAVSLNGQYMIAASSCEDGDCDEEVCGLYISDDFGFTFSRSTGSPKCLKDNLHLHTVALDSTGQHMSAISNSTFYMSNNYGKTWLSTTPSLGALLSGGLAISGDTSLLALISTSPSTLLLSSDLGQTWQASLNISTLTQLILKSSQFEKRLNSHMNDDNHIDLILKDIAVSYNGLYLAALCGDNNLFLSTDRGQSWTSRPISLSHTHDNIIHYLSMDGSGRYLVLSGQSTDPHNGDSIILYTSDDFGSNWAISLMEEGSDFPFQALSISSNGCMIVAVGGRGTFRGSCLS
jgi:hypothetical protein